VAAGGIDYGEFQLDREGAAASGLALGADRSTHQLN
jgi:hypothetical protein